MAREEGGGEADEECVGDDATDEPGDVEGRVGAREGREGEHYVVHEEVGGDAVKQSAQDGAADEQGEF